MARGSKPRRRPLDAEQVLSGQVAVDVRQLVDLIVAVNPTGRDLEPGDEQRRYRLKSRLQDLLIARFAGEIEVVDDQEDDRVVLLRHRASGRSACHAVVDELDDASRSWVRRQLDEERAGPVEPEDELAWDEALDDAEGGPETSADLIALGQAALEIFDYDAARTHFRQALARSSGSVEAALPLLEFLVDHLAADDEALSLEERLSPEAGADHQVRLLLASAAARAGHAGRAEALLGGAEGERAREVYCALANAALSSGDTAEAARLLHRARLAAPVSHDLIELEAELERRRAEARAPAEAAIIEARAAGRDDQAEDLARALLAGHDSAVARRALSEIAGERRQARIRELFERAEAAIAGESYERAARLLREALEHGADQAEVAPRLERAEVEVRAQSDRRRVAEVDRLLSSGDHRAALSAYLDLSRPLRERVGREKLLDWIDGTDALASGAKRRAAIEAVLALRDAVAALEAGAPQRASSRLAGHEKPLSRIRDYRDLAARIDALLDAERAERARALLERSEAALESGDTAGARAHLEAMTRGDLEVGELERLAVLASRLQTAESLGRLRRRLEAALERDDWFAAREAAETLAERDAGEARWIETARSLSARIRSEWQVRRYDDPPVAPPRGFPLFQGGPDVTFSLTPDGARVILVDTQSPWLLICAIDLASGDPVCRVSLRLAVEDSGFETVTVDDRGLWIAGFGGRILLIDLDTLEIEQWRHLTADIEGFRFSRIEIPPNGQYAWLELETLGYELHARTVDTSRWRKHRVVGELTTMSICPGGRELRICVQPPLRSARIHRPGGSPTDRVIDRDIEIIGAVTHPDGERLVVSHHDPDTGEILISVWGGSGRLGPALAIEDSYWEAANVIAVSLDAGLVFLAHSLEEASELVAMRPAGDRLDILWRTLIPDDTSLTSDAGARRVVAVAEVEDGVQALVLGPEPPRFRPGLSRLRPWPSFSAELCGRVESARSTSLRSWLEAEGADMVKHRAAMFARDQSGDPDELLGLYDALRALREEQPAADLIARAHADHPDHPGIRIARSETLASEAKWPRVRELLEDLDSGDADPRRRQHHLHLLGLAQIECGDLEAARHSLREAASIEEGDCDILVCLALVDPTAEGPRTGTVKALVAAIHAADERLAAGDPAGAIAALDRPGVWQFLEIQHLARATAALLELDPPAIDRFDKTHRLATFCAQHRLTSFGRHELRIPGAIWDRERLEELAARARLWLAEHV